MSLSAGSRAASNAKWTQKPSNIVEDKNCPIKVFSKPVHSVNPPQTLSQYYGSKIDTIDFLPLRLVHTVIWIFNQAEYPLMPLPFSQHSCLLA